MQPGEPKTSVSFAAFAAIATLAAPARAQVNTEALRSRIKRQGASLVLQGTLDGNTGNVHGVTADALVGAGFSAGRHLAFAFASIDYSKLNGVLGVDKAFAHARYDYELSPWLWWEVFAQAQSDYFDRITIRNLVGAGPRLALYDDERVGIFLGAAYMLEGDVIEVAPGASDPRTPFYSRASTYLSARAKLSDGIEAVTTTYVQPRVEDPSDVRVLSESGFIFKVNKLFSTAVTFTAHYDSNPPSEVLPTDTELKNVIQLML